MDNWTRFVDLVQTAFREGELAEEAKLQALVLIPKGKKDYRGIVLVEVMWKVVAAILNRRFTASITYHDFLHRFRAGCGTGTATPRPAATSACGLEGGGPVRDLPGPAQGV